MSVFLFCCPQVHGRWTVQVLSQQIPVGHAVRPVLTTCLMRELLYHQQVIYEFLSKKQLSWVVTVAAKEMCKIQVLTDRYRLLPHSHLPKQDAPSLSLVFPWSLRPEINLFYCLDSGTGRTAPHPVCWPALLKSPEPRLPRGVRLSAG